MGFFQSCWDVIREDLLKVFQESHSIGKFEKSLNNTFFALLPKKMGVYEMKDFWPINLVNGVYKIISKILAIHLGEVWEKISQNSKMLLFEVGKFWTLLSLLMSA